LRSNAVDTGNLWPDWTVASERFAACLDEIIADPRYQDSRQPDRLVQMQRIEAALLEPHSLPIWRSAFQLLPSWIQRHVFEARIRWWAHVASTRPPRDFGD
jgi:hypothetical protein